ncbi:hypothetical protein [Spirosoma flavum]|uniref:Serine hydrolase n=1 Tax=Spirosoma flavum TaxID=2048557 RepID=A0ABW6ASU2_9BACT
MINLSQLWFVLFLLPVAGYAQSQTKIQSQQKLLQQLDTYLQTQIDTAKQSPVPGIAIAIVKGK